ncbi:MAG: MCE family protein, partial [Mycobacterium sp.]
VNTLILNANDFVGVLTQRRQAIVNLLANTSAVAKQLTGLVHDNEAKLAPTLAKLNSVTEVLQKNRDNIAQALPGLAKFALTIGEAVGNGHYYSAFVPNLTQLEMVQPFLDYLWGFRSFNTEFGPGPHPSPFPRSFFPWPLLENFYGRP